MTRSLQFGLSIDRVRIDMAAVRDRKRRMVDGLIEMHRSNFAASGADLIIGTGRFIGPKILEVTGADGRRQALRAEKVVISTGSRAVIDPIPGLAEAHPLTHIEALELDRAPPHLLIIGGGYTGLEFAQAMRRLGSAVTLIDRNPRLVHREDEDVSDALQDLFWDEGIGVITPAEITRVEGRSGESVTLHLRREGAMTTVTGTHLLIATGRRPNTENIGLELAGVETTAQGFVKVNERLETTAPGVWAVGDCAGSPQFTHIAFDDFRIVRDNLAGGRRETTGRLVPFCIFTDPGFARVGLSETEARRRGMEYRLVTLPMAAVLRTRTLSETRGFLKALVDASSDRILGFAAFGVDAGELIAPVQVAMTAGLPFTALSNAIFTHPTLAEGLIALFANVPPLTTDRPGNPATASETGRSR